jgi:hypothetical protein
MHCFAAQLRRMAGRGGMVASPFIMYWDEAKMAEPICDYPSRNAQPKSRDS